MTIRAAEATVAALTVVLLGVILAPLVLNPYLPLEDLPNHIARRYLATTAGGVLDTYYTFGAGLGTNAAVDMAWMAFGPWAADAMVFSRWAIGFAMAGFVISVAVLHRVLHGYWSAWPLASVLLVYNANLVWGFENFVVTVPLAFLGLALWIATRERALALRLGTAVLATAVLYLGHVLVLLLYAVLVFSFEAGRAWRGGRINLRAANWAGLVVVGAACGAYVVLTLAQPAPDYGTATSFGMLADRLEMILSPFGSERTGSALLPLAGQGPLILAGIGLALLLGRRLGLSVVMAQGMGLPVMALALVTLVMPAQLSGVYFTHLRYPFILLGLLIAATDLRGGSLRLKGVLTLALIVVVALRAHVLDRAAQTYSQEVSDLRALSAEVPAGARVLPVSALGTERATTQHFHTAAYLVPFADAFVPTLFVGGSHALGITAQWQHLSAPQPAVLPAEMLAPGQEGRIRAETEAWGYADNWQAHYTHVLVIGPLPAGLAQALPLRPIASRGIFTLHAMGADPGP